MPDGSRRWPRLIPEAHMPGWQKERRMHCETVAAHPLSPPRRHQVLANDPNFLRISKGTYSLHCFHPDKEQLVKAVQVRLG